MSDCRGYTLIECLIVLLLTALLWHGAMQVLPAWRLQSEARQLAAILQQTLDSLRLRAAREQRDWAVCMARDGQHCDSDWQARWLAFSDANGDSIRQPDEALAPLSLSIPPGWQLRWRGFRNQPALLWLASGDAATSNGTLTLCPPAPQDAALRQLVLSKSGRLRLVLPQQAGASTLKSARGVCGWP